MGALKNLVGAQFGRLTVTGREVGRWVCSCSCGKEHRAQTNNLTSGKIRSCGCLAQECRSALGKSHLRHGHTQGGRTTPEFRAWKCMLDRCSLKSHNSFKHYGARGIKVCKQWKNFEVFLADMGLKPSKRHSLDRFPNVNGDYEPGNVRWSTVEEQQNNKRSTHFITHNEVTLSLSQWARAQNISVSTLQGRLRKGWAIERALAKPSPSRTG